MYTAAAPTFVRDTTAASLPFHPPPPSTHNRGALHMFLSDRRRRWRPLLATLLLQSMSHANIIITWSIRNVRAHRYRVRRHSRRRTGRTMSESGRARARVSYDILYYYHCCVRALLLNYIIWEHARGGDTIRFYPKSKAHHHHHHHQCCRHIISARPTILWSKPKDHARNAMTIDLLFFPFHPLVTDIQIRRSQCQCW